MEQVSSLNQNLMDHLLFRTLTSSISGCCSFISYPSISRFPRIKPLLLEWLGLVELKLPLFKKTYKYSVFRSVLSSGKFQSPSGKERMTHIHVSYEGLRAQYPVAVLSSPLPQSLYSQGQPLLLEWLRLCLVELLKNRKHFLKSRCYKVAVYNILFSRKCCLASTTWPCFAIAKVHKIVWLEYKKQLITYNNQVIY